MIMQELTPKGKLVWERTHFVRSAKAKPSGAAEKILMSA
jgi:hypothetical protein